MRQDHAVAGVARAHRGGADPDRRSGNACADSAPAKAAIPQRGAIQRRGDDPHHPITRSPASRARSSPAAGLRSSMRPFSSGGNAICFATSQRASRAVRHLRHRRARGDAARARVLRRARLGTDASEAVGRCSSISCAPTRRLRRTSGRTSSPTTASVRSRTPIDPKPGARCASGSTRRRPATAGSAAPASRGRRAPELPEKLAFLLRPDSYAEGTSASDAVETPVVGLSHRPSTS